CGICGLGYHGDSCEYVDIPDSNLRSALCLAVTNPSAHDSSCDDLTVADMATVTSVSASTVDSFEGLQHAVNLTSLSISGTSSSSVSIGNTDLAYLPLSLTDLTLEAVYLDADSDFTSFIALTTLSLNDNTEYDITESGLFPSPSSLTSFSANNTSISLLFHLVASMPNLTELSLNNNNISDPSPLYALSSNTSWSSIDISYNHICGGDNGDSEVQTFLASKFSLSAADVNASGQDCICSSDDLGSTPLASNKVCSETKPGSGSWYVVCASDSYTSYTSAEDFTCMQTTSPTTNCSGGCEYGYECRYLGDEEIGDDTFTTGECQQVIIDESLHPCVADMFVDSDGNADYEHRTEPIDDDSNPIPSLFSVASLKTLESALDTGTDEYSPILSCSNSTSPISVLSGLEHLVGISEFQLSNDGLTDTSELSSLSALTLLKRLDLSSNSSLSSLPDLSDVSLAILNINATSIVLPDTSASTQLIPDSLVELHMYDTPTVQAGFDTQV
ncbi:Acidic leucine-rich nuclear phosphoprotein 32 like protein, partial [Aduncisulcus paluster]